MILRMWNTTLTRVVGKPRSTCCLQENAIVLRQAPCAVMLCGGVCGVGR